MPPKKKKEPQIDRRVVKGGHIEGAGQVVSQPITETLRENYTELLAEKRRVYADYKQTRSDMRELYNIRANVENLLELSPQQEVEKETQKSRF